MRREQHLKLALSLALSRALSSALTFALLLTGCSVAEPRGYARIQNPAMERSRHSSTFVHRTLERGLEKNPKTLRLYFGGDGTPWVAGRYAAIDPTPTENPIEDLFALDEGPALLIGRPCYHGTSTVDACEPALWTSARYGAEVILSMYELVESYIQTLEPSRLVLVGYSGGGVIATALAPMLSRPSYTVTIAANLDVSAWQRWHRYLPLKHSLNPADYPRYYAVRPQLHLQGVKDLAVPPQTTHAYLAWLPDSAVRRYAEADHHCCWEPIWAAILSEAPWERQRTSVPP